MCVATIAAADLRATPKIADIMPFRRLAEDNRSKCVNANKSPLHAKDSFVGSNIYYNISKRYPEL